VNAAIWICLVAFALGGFFTSVQMSLRTASRARAKRFAAAKQIESRVDAVFDNRHEHALAVSVVRMLSLLVGVGALFVWAIGPDVVLADHWRRALLGSVLGGGLLYLFGAAVPMSVAEHAGEALVLRVAPLLRVLRTVCSPLIGVAGFVDEVVRRLAGVPELTEEEELEEEILSVVSEKREEGSLDESGRDMIEAVVDFRTSTVEEIMTPRTEIEGIQLTDDLAAVRDFIAQAGHSRIPVYEENLDQIAGLLYAKDLLQYLGGDVPAFDLRSMLREARFVPETKRLDELLAEFQRDKVHLAIVLDEYGGTAGLVTIEDVIEEIVGEIYDEYEPDTDTPPEIRVQAEERAAVIDGRAYIDDVNDRLEELGAELPEHEDYDTIGGYVTSSLGHIPVAGESFRHNGFLVTVLEAEPTRVAQVRLELVEDISEHDRPVPVESPDESDGSEANTGK